MKAPAWWQSSRQKDFIILERYAGARDADTWTAALNSALAPLPVTVIQSTSDEAPALLCHVERDLGAHHSPDLSLMQHEASKGVSLPLAGRVRKAQQSYEAQRQQREDRERASAAATDAAAGGAAEQAEARKVELLRWREQQAQAALQKAARHQEQAQVALRGISARCHPVDLATGTLQDAGEVGERLEEHFYGPDHRSGHAGMAGHAGLGTAL